jgi:hypothetical protein
MEREPPPGAAGWATPMKGRGARGAPAGTPSDAGLASPASAFGFPASAQAQKFRPRPLFAEGAPPQALQTTLLAVDASLRVVRRSAPGAPGAPRRAPKGGVDLCAPGGAPESPTASGRRRGARRRSGARCISLASFRLPGCRPRSADAPAAPAAPAAATCATARRPWRPGPRCARRTRLVPPNALQAPFRQALC